MALTSSNEMHARPCMKTDIFRFWGKTKIKPYQTIHPADRDVFSRVGQLGRMFDLRCLPNSFGGRLKDAPVVLLYLSPGFRQQDIRDARTKRGQAEAAKRRSGRHPFPKDGSKWLRSRTKVLNVDYEQLRCKLFVLNIGAYHAKTFRAHPLLAALPSSRVSLDWAQHVLFPQAIRGERVVICMRAASYWGLEPGRRYGRSLFAPFTTRGGHMRKKTRREKEFRRDIIRAVRRKIKSQG